MNSDTKLVLPLGKDGLGFWRAGPAEAGPTTDPNPTGVAMLTTRLVRGEEEAYQEFHRRYFDRLLRYLLVITLGDEQAARDALQETLLRVVRHVRSFATEEAFWSWLTVLARSAARDGGRRRQRYGKLLDRYAQFLLGRAREHLPNDSAGLSEDATLTRIADQSLQELPSLERALLEGKYLEERSIKELAAENGLTEKSVESRLQRARQRLKQTVLNRLKLERKTEP